MKKLILIAGCLFLTIPCVAETITVDDDGPADFNNIQAAINDANDGDTILVADGTYTGSGNYDIDFLGKAITVRSATGPQNCIINCENNGDAFGFYNAEDASSVLDGFTITNSDRAIHCQGSSPTIKNCIITANTYPELGVILSSNYASPTVANCTISNNVGSGVCCYSNGNTTIKNCTITNNTGYGRDGSGGGIAVIEGLCLVYDSIIHDNNINQRGGAIYCAAGGIAEVINSTIANNSAEDGGGIWCKTASSEIRNSIIWANSDSSGTGQSAQIYSETGSPDVWFSCIQDGNSNDSNIPFGAEQFNIDDDPCWVDADSNDFHLLSGSPCIDTGDPNFVSEPDETDIDGEQRVMGGRVDIGADELTAELIPIIKISDEDFVFYSPLGGDPEPQILSIYNAGSGTLNWQIIEDCPWLTAEPNSGSSTGQVNNINLLVDISALNGGQYYCNLIISDPNASNTPQSVSVTLTVDEYAGPTIQAAINNANNGDTIIMVDGTYKGMGNRDIDFLGKAITVRSANGPNSCIIDCNGLGRGFYFHNDEDPNSVLNGFTIINGYGSDGGGITCNNSNPKITNCNITGNSAGEGAGIYCSSSRPVINSCLITGNSAEYDGGGVRCYYNSNPQFTNCTIAGNSAGNDGGGISCHNSNPAINNSIVWDNSDSSGTGQSAQIYDDGEQLNVWFSCIQDDDPDDEEIPFGDFSSNIDDDPCFVDADSNDFHLKAASPCIDAGDPYFADNTSDVDIDSQSRVMGQYVDMGADEFELSIIIVTKPQAGDVWAAGSTHQIEWDSYDVNGTVDIIAQRPGPPLNVLFIEVNVPDTGSYAWNIPSESDGWHTIVVEPSIAVPDFVCVNSGLFIIQPYSPGPPVASTWKSLGGNYDRTGLSEHFGPEIGCVKWQFQTDGPVSASSTVGAAGQIHLACEDGKLYTLDPNGQLLWSYDANSPLLSSPSVGPDGSVFVGAQNGKLYAIDVNGNIRWTYATEGSISSSPAVSDDGDIYIGSQDGKLYALAQNGSELWTFQTAGPGVATGAIFASPAIGPDGTIYVTGLYDPNLYALDPNNGSVKWNCTFTDPYDDPYNLNHKLAPFASPVVAPNGIIYQTLLHNPIQLKDDDEPNGPFWYDSRLYAINPNNGSVLWSTDMTETAKQNEEPFPPEPNYWFEQYYAENYESVGYPYTYTYWGDRGTKRYYRVSNSSWSESVLSPDEVIYSSFNDRHLRAVDPNGTIEGVTPLGWFGGFTMTVGSDGLIYAASDEGYLSVVDPNGKEIARFERDGELTFPVIAADNLILVCDSDNAVWAITGDDCEGLPADLHRPEDLNADWAMNLIDFAEIAGFWLECTDTSYDPVADAPYCKDNDNAIFLLGDINWDQYVNFDDLAEIANHWLSEE